MPVARWAADAVDLSEDPTQCVSYKSLTQVSEATGLSVATIRDSMLRDPITDPDNPRGAICRPAARIGGQMNAVPLWSERQLDDFHARTERRDAAKLNPARMQLPRITPEDAARRGLASTEDIAEKLGRAVNTLRRYVRDYTATFPPEVAISALSTGPTPLGFRHAGDVARWVAEHETADAGERTGHVAVTTG